MLLAVAVPTARATPWSLSVVDEKGAPVQKAHVRIFSGWRDKIEVLETDEMGRAAGDIEPLYPSWLGTVFIFAPGHAPSGGTLRVGENRARLNMPRTLEGRITDENRKPLANIDVTLTNVFSDPSSVEKRTLENSADFALDLREYPFFTTRTDAQGRYVIFNVPRAGTARIAVTDALWQSRAVRVELLDVQTVPDIKTLPAARLRGRILQPDGTPAANLRVFAAGKEGYTQAETDAEGRYRLGGLAAGNVYIKPDSTRESAVGVAAPVRSEAIAGTETEVPDIRMSQGAFLEWKTTPDVVGDRISVISTDPLAEVEYYFHHARDITRERIVPGTYRVRVQRAPRGLSIPRDFPADGVEIKAVEGQTSTVELRYDPALSFKGIARDAAGKPLAGVQFVEPDSGTNVVSDAEGRFALSGFAPGEHALSVGSDWEIVAPQKVTLPATQPVAVTVKKILQVPLRGRVVDDTGAPVVNATVRVEWSVNRPDGSGYPRRIERRTDAEGRYEFAAVRADVDVSVEAEKARHRLVRNGDITIARTIVGINGAAQPNPNAAYEISDIVMQPLTREAEGRVVDSKGVPVANALVAALGGGEKEQHDALPGNITRTDAEGRFHLEDLPEGELGFVAGKGDGFAQVRSKLTLLPDLILQPQTKAQPDLAKARELVFELIETTRGDDFWLRNSQPYTLAPYDFEGAIAAYKALQGAKPLPPEILRAMFSKLIEADEKAAHERLAALLPELERDTNDTFFVSFLLDIAKFVSQPEQALVAGEDETAARVRALLRSGFKGESEKLARIDVQKSTDYEISYRFAALAMLAARLGDKEAFARLAKNAMEIATRFDAVQTNEFSILGGIVESLAEASPTSVENTLLTVPPQSRAGVLSRAVPAVAKTDILQARRLLELIPLQMKLRPQDKLRVGNTEPDWAFGVAATAVLARMTQADAADALALARRVTEDYHRSEALAFAARLQPTEEAAKLFHEAFEITTKAPGNRRATKIAAIALQFSPTLGAELLGKIEDAFFTTSRRLQGDTPAIPAFYLARIEPGRARVWLEWQWAHGQNTANGYNGLADLEKVVASMNVVDTARAIEMAASIPPHRNADGSEDYSSRWQAQGKIAQFLTLPEATRQKMFLSD